MVHHLRHRGNDVRDVVPRRLGIRALAAFARHAPVALRLALRDLARYQARSAAALGAISLALAIAATIAISASALATPSISNLAANQLVLSPTIGSGGAFKDSGLLRHLSAQQAADLQSRVSSLAASLHAKTTVALTMAIDPASGTFAPSDFGENGGGRISAAPSGKARGVVPVTLAYVVRSVHGSNTGISISESLPVYVATPAVLAHYGIDPTTIAANTDLLTSRRDLGGLSLIAPRPFASLPGCPTGLKCRSNDPSVARGPFEWHPKVQNVDLPNSTDGPTTLLTEHAVRAFGLQTIPAGWLIETPHALATAQISLARHAAAAAGATVETRSAPASYDRLRNGATAVGLLVALGVLAMTVGLIRSETANDLRVLAATGATSATRRTLTGATAGALGLLGALFGTAGAYLALIAWHRSDLHPLTRVPYLDLVIIIVGLPLIAVVAGWLLAGREPSAIARRPLD